MNENELLKEGQDLREWESVDCDGAPFDLDALESQLQDELIEQLSDLSVLGEDRKKIGNPEFLGNTIKDVVWEHFCNTWTWTGVVDGKTVSVSCPKLAWE